MFRIAGYVFVGVLLVCAGAFLNEYKQELDKQNKGKKKKKDGRGER